MDNTNETPVTQQQMEDAKKKGGKVPPQFLKKMGKSAGGKGGKSMKAGKGASKGKMGGC
jgi:hypothetical protein